MYQTLYDSLACNENAPKDCFLVDGPLYKRPVAPPTKNFSPEKESTKHLLLQRVELSSLDQDIGIYDQPLYIREKLGVSTPPQIAPEPSPLLQGSYIPSVPTIGWIDTVYLKIKELLGQPVPQMYFPQQYPQLEVKQQPRHPHPIFPIPDLSDLDPFLPPQVKATNPVIIKPPQPEFPLPQATTFVVPAPQQIDANVRPAPLPTALTKKATTELPPLDLKKKLPDQIDVPKPQPSLFPPPQTLPPTQNTMPPLWEPKTETEKVPNADGQAKYPSRSSAAFLTAVNPDQPSRNHISRIIPTTSKPIF